MQYQMPVDRGLKATTNEARQTEGQVAGEYLVLEEIKRLQGVVIHER
jgi:hypothetical protein